MEFYELKTEAKAGLKSCRNISYILEKNKELIFKGRDAFLGAIMPYYFKAKENFPYSREDISSLELISLSVSNPDFYMLEGLKDWVIPDIKTIILSCKNKEYSASINENKSVMSAVSGLVGFELNTNVSAEITEYLLVNNALNE